MGQNSDIQKQINEIIKPFLDSDKETVKRDFLKMQDETRPEEIQAINDFMSDYYRDITSTQLRNLFNELKKAELSNLLLKKAKLAYITGRTNKDKIGMLAFLHLLDLLIDKVFKDTEIQIEGLITFLEASLSYHKYYEKLNPKSKQK
ncbi:type III-A CRISPR-associated protein Csm2 [Thermophagus sp. OGC60D27]|uniref:type III-A CRISPR-associated protein Csm2 n=1 Tax=Thermophagus sp. OGC60D27 TaxID=3458415 RepID=UPI0040378DB9